MPKRRVHALFELPLNHPDHPWTARGYRADIAHIQKTPAEDPLGEVAYQRAFLETAAKNPRRMPDPALYPNSHSAREFIARMDKAIFSVKKTDSQPAAAATSPGNSTHTTTSPTATGQQYSSLPSPGYMQSPSSSSSSSRRARANGDDKGVSVPSAAAGVKTSPVGTTERLPFSSPPRPADYSHSPSGDRQGGQSPPFAPHGVPLVLEPKIDGPTGPSRMLR